jgi:lipopolysaccharide transport system permease protein
MSGRWVNITPTISPQKKWMGYWNLMLSLVRRDIQARYRRTFLGPLWAIIPAVMTMVIFSLLRGVVDIDSEGVPYVVFAFSTIVPWTYFQKALTNIPNGVISNGGLLRKMAVPRAIFPLIGMLTALFDFAMSFIVLVGILLLNGVPITIAWVWLPLLMLLLSLLAWIVGIGISAISVYRRDILRGLAYIVQLWFFATPVVYSFNEVQGTQRALYSLNPTVGIIDGFRQVLVFGKAPDTDLLLVGFVVMVLVLVVTYPLYRSMSRYFADVL